MGEEYSCCSNGPDSPAIAAWGSQDKIFESIYNRPKVEQRNERNEAATTTTTTTAATTAAAAAVARGIRGTSQTRVDCWQQPAAKQTSAANGKATTIKQQQHLSPSFKRQGAMCSPSTRLFTMTRATPRTKRGERKLLPKKRIQNLDVVSKINLDGVSKKTDGKANGSATARDRVAYKGSGGWNKRRPHSAKS